MFCICTNWLTMKLAFCLSLHQMNILDKLSRNGGFTANHHKEQNISCQRNLHSAVSSAHCVCLFTAWLERHVGCSLYLGGQDWPHGLPTRNIEIDLFSSDTTSNRAPAVLLSRTFLARRASVLYQYYDSSFPTGPAVQCWTSDAVHRKMLSWKPFFASPLSWGLTEIWFAH